MKLNVHRIIEKTKAEGPGQRFCIWVQGCSLNCKNCFMQKAHSKKGGVLINVNEIFDEIKKIQNEIQGVTFLGGEPFEQAHPVSFLAEGIQKLNLNVITFTGYTIEELKQKNDKYINKLLKYTDLLIDGRFIENQRDFSRGLAGSKNQRFIFLTDKIDKNVVQSLKNKLEIRIDKNGQVNINGMANTGIIKHILASVL